MAEPNTPFDDRRLQASHIVVTVFARGLLNHAVTRLYFGAEAEANKEDPLLKQLGKRAETLIASRKDADGVAAYDFNIRLQGDGETVFLDI